MGFVSSTPSSSSCCYLRRSPEPFLSAVGSSTSPASRCSLTGFPTCPGSRVSAYVTAFWSPVTSPSACTRKPGNSTVISPQPASSLTAPPVPGPTIEALQGVPTHITWHNHLPSRHILPWDPTIPTPSATSGVPTVVHLHGGVHHPSSDDHSHAWFTSNLSAAVGPSFSSPTSSYPNLHDPGNLWYHDHALRLTRVNLLAGLHGAYVLRSPALESPSACPPPLTASRHLVLFDRSFHRDGSLFLNSTGNNPSIHPQWQPEYFGDAIIVNGKAWPFLAVRPRRYRFRIINASNARFFRLSFSSNSSLGFLHLGSDSVYLPRPVPSRSFLLAPSEIADVVVDFAVYANASTVLLNDAAYPFPSGDTPDEFSGRVMKFLIAAGTVGPARGGEAVHCDVRVRERGGGADASVHQWEGVRCSGDGDAADGEERGVERDQLDGGQSPASYTPGALCCDRAGELVGLEELKKCMTRINDAGTCHVEEHARGRADPVPAHERGWKNVFKMQPGFVTRILVQFAMLRTEKPYPFDSAEPGYVYHCHILDHEDNVMMSPLKLLP